MSEPDTLVAALCTYFGDRVPPHLGREAYFLTKRRLAAEGYPDRYHAEEVFAMALTNAIKYLSSHGGEAIRQPRAWFHTLCRRACASYLKDLTLQTTYTLSSVIEGEGFIDSAMSDQQSLRLVRQAIAQLKPRHQQLINLDLVLCLAPARIQEEMHLPSNGAFRVLKHEAFAALREAVRALIDSGIGQLFS
jgi:DNA-directed RNA polymerase specialized sigma24 family protein